MSIFTVFDKLLNPTAVPGDAPPSASGGAFYWHFTRQVKGLLIALFVVGSITAVFDAAIPVFIGRVVTILTGLKPETGLANAWPQLVGMSVVLLILRPVMEALQDMITNQAINPGMSNMVRWQNHWHVVRQSWSFFQNDFAGRIANRVMQTGPALRESVVSGINAVWYILVYGTIALGLLAARDARLAIPVVLWFLTYAGTLWFFVPRVRSRSKAMSEARSNLTGRIVDSYTNILTVKLFADPKEEDEFVRSSVDAHTSTFRAQLRFITGFGFTLTVLNAAMMVGTAGVALYLWSAGSLSVGEVAMAVPLTWQISNVSGWVARNVTSIFENIGTVQDGMRSIAVPLQLPDAPNATALHVTKGAVKFDNLTFGYNTARGVLHGINIEIAPGERVGLVGPSGAGKSTLVNLLLHFYALESGRILIDGTDIATVTQDSLRARIAMVTQDTSLLHRSIAENIRYGKPEATDAQVRDAAARAHAIDFIEGLEDWQHRKGFEAHVGERGVKLSGGQRQRIALARVILKDAPILILDEATSALDSEVEAAIQEQLDDLMQGRTVIAIAHRLSTIARMDRLIVLDEGRVTETGSHAELVQRGGTYARLWRRQSGGFDIRDIRADVPEPAIADD